MATDIDLGGNNVYANDFVIGAAAGTVSSTSSGATVGLGHAGYWTYFLKGINFNSATTDNKIVITLPSGITTYYVQSVMIWGASHTLTTATASLWTAAGGTGTAICADQAITITSGTANTNLNFQTLTLNTNPAAGTICFTSNPLYFRIGTAEGAAATANVNIIIHPLS
jgi:hypothetical protein